MISRLSRLGLFGRMVIVMGSNEEIFWGGTSTKIQLYSAINIKSLVLFRFAKQKTM